MLLDDWFGKMPKPLRGPEGPRRFLPDWPKSLRSWVVDVVQSTDYIRLDENRVDSSIAKFEPYAGILSALALQFLLDEYLALVIEQDPQEEMRENVRKALVLYHALAAEARPGLRSWPKDWLEAGVTAQKSARVQLGKALFDQDPELFGTLAAFANQAAYPYSLIFPVVPVNAAERGRRVSEGDPPGYLIRARMFLLRPDKAATDGMRLALAPWSLFLRRQGEVAELEGSFQTLADASVERFGFLKGRSMLLDLQPVEDCPGVLPPAASDIIVEQASLGLAVVSAAWASTRRPMFKRVVMTGQIFDDKIGEVSDIEDKYKTTRWYAREGNLSCIFVAPRNAGGTPGLPSSKDGIDVVTVGDWKTYFDEQMPRLLTDGFDWYRAVPKSDRSIFQCSTAESDDFGVYLDSDVHEITSVVDGALDSPIPAFSLIVLPFDNDPEIAARFAVGRLCERICREAGGGQRFADETPIPVLYPLSPARGFAGEAPDEVVLEAMSTWPGIEWNRDREALVRDVFRRFPGDFLLVVYGQSSMRSDGYDADKQEVTRLADWVQRAHSRSRPRICFIASDEHHHRFLADDLRKIAPLQSAATARPRAAV